MIPGEFEIDTIQWKRQFKGENYKINICMCNIQTLLRLYTYAMFMGFK